MATVTVDQMKEKLLTLDQVRERLANTEPLATDVLDSGSKVRFKLEPGWETTLDALEGTDVVSALVTFGGKERSLTKDAVLQAASAVGVPTALVKKTPSKYIEALMNYFYGPGLGDEAFKALSVGDSVAAFTKPTITPFSNLALLESTLDGIARRYGSSEVFGDYKISNSLAKTDVRLIVPEHVRAIQNSGMDDLPAGNGDLWSAGIHLSNSLIGKGQTTVEAYLFRWWCTNGATEEDEKVGVWSRRSNGQDEEDVYEWARGAVDDILGGMEERFDQVQALTSLSVARNAGDILKEIFTQYEVPVSQRDQIRERVQEMPNLTLYTLMNAITETANVTDLTPARADRLMRIGGLIPTSTFDTMKAQLWREGHTADPEAANPYEVQPV